MRRTIFLWAASIAVVLIAAVAVLHVERTAPGTGRQDFAVMLAPPGVTLTVIGKPVESDGVTYLRPYRDGDAFRDGATVFSDAKGLPYYTYDKDTDPAKPACTGNCRAAWPPATAPADAGNLGDWSVVTHDGAKQWVYKNKPLYTFAKDETPGDAMGDGAEDGAWHLVVFKPGAGKPRRPDDGFKPAMPGGIPFGIAVHENEAAGGQVLTDDLGRTLYAFDGDPKDDTPACAAQAQCGRGPFLPVAAPALASGIGDFTVVQRADGTGQWAYKAWPLYRYAGDLAAGQSGGVDIDKRWRMAVVVRYPTPAPVTVRATPTMGRIFATSDGKTLYRQYLYYYAAEAGDFEHGYPYNEIVGRLVGGRGCTGDCTKTWHPFVASAEARPAGHWTIVTRPDGSRQWGYKGYALYTFDGDKKPGDLLGLDSWDITPSDPALHAVSLFSTLKIDAESVTGMFFTTVYP